MNTYERIFGHPFVSQSHVNYLLKTFHITDNGIRLATANDFQVHFVVADKFAVYLCQSNVVLSIYGLNHILHVTAATVIAGNGALLQLDSDEFSDIVVMSAEDGE